LPSGETVGFDVHLSINGTGSPPSIETFQALKAPERAEWKTTQRPSGEDFGKRSPGPPVVSCFRLPPSVLMRQMLHMLLEAFIRVEVKMM
jgi:hypothetical protein